MPVKISTYLSLSTPPCRFALASMETTIFQDHDGGTQVTTISVFQTVEDRDDMLKSGMEEGKDESMDRLEELLAKMRVGVQARINSCPKGRPTERGSALLLSIMTLFGAPA